MESAAGFFIAHISKYSNVWDINFNVQLKCFQATPYSMGDKHFLTVEQVIPRPAAEEFMMKVADKNRDDIKSKIKSKKDKEIYTEFWSKLLPIIKSKPTRFQNSKPSYKPWLGVNVGIRGISLGFHVIKSTVRVQLYIDGDDKGGNENIFNELSKSREQIDKDFGEGLDWERKDKHLHCRVQFEQPKNFSDKGKWDRIIDFMTNTMVKLENAFNGPIANLKDK